MKPLNLAAAATLFASTLAAVSQSVRCGQSLDAPLHRGAELTIASLSTEITVVGTDQDTLHISCRADDPNTANDVRIQLSGTADHAKLTITGDHFNRNNLHLRVEVPRKLDLALHMPAGAVKVEDLEGNKDIQLTAGQISIAADRDWDYKDVNASVDIGEVNAQVYGANKGGFFRAFRKQNDHGEYRLRAHIMTGQIDLLGKTPTNAASE
jgi:hypothetical protein